MQTKFRAFQLDSPGSLFSYYKEGYYTLIEARIPKRGIGDLVKDINFHNKQHIDCLHITSWDDDHCNYYELIKILNELRPDLIETPSYIPDSDSGRLCYNLINGYDAVHQKRIYNVVSYDQETISKLGPAESWGNGNVLYQSLFNVDNKNDMSQIRLFRSNGFSVLSLGDCESKEITSALMLSGDILKNEVDILILPHHGSENSMLTGEFLDFCKPILAVCSSNYDNRFEHPRPSVYQLLSSRGIKLMTTKRGDIIAKKDDHAQRCNVLNLSSNNTNVDEQFNFMDKKHELGLKMALNR